MAVDDVFENRAKVRNILVLLLKDAFGKFEYDVESNLGLNQYFLTLVFHADVHELALAIVDLLFCELNFHTLIVLLNDKRTFLMRVFFVDRLGDVFFHIFLLILIIVFLIHGFLCRSLILILQSFGSCSFLVQNTLDLLLDARSHWPL